MQIAFLAIYASPKTFENWCVRYVNAAIKFRRGGLGGTASSPPALALCCRLKHAPPDLIFLNGLKQGAEITLAKAIVAFALDEFEEHRPDHVGREDLQQRTDMRAAGNDFAVDQDAQGA